MDQPRNGHPTRNRQWTILQRVWFPARLYLSRLDRPNLILIKPSHWRWFRSLLLPQLHLLFQWKPARHPTNLPPLPTQQEIVSLSTTSRSLTIYKKKRRSYNPKRQLKSYESQSENFEQKLAFCKCIRHKEATKVATCALSLIIFKCIEVHNDL